MMRDFVYCVFRIKNRGFWVEKCWFSRLWPVATARSSCSTLRLTKRTTALCWCFLMSNWQSKRRKLFVFFSSFGWFEKKIIIDIIILLFVFVVLQRYRSRIFMFAIIRIKCLKAWRTHTAWLEPHYYFECFWLWVFLKNIFFWKCIVCEGHFAQWH